MLTKTDIKDKLNNSSELIIKYGVIKIGLFGSYIRNEQKEDSDIDIYIEFDPDKENFDNFINLCFLLDSLFKDNKVEVVTKNGLSEYIGPSILKEIEYVKITD